MRGGGSIFFFPSPVIIISLMVYHVLCHVVIISCTECMKTKKREGRLCKVLLLACVSKRPLTAVYTHPEALTPTYDY